MFNIFKKKKRLTTVDFSKQRDSYFIHFKEPPSFPLREKIYCEILEQIFSDKKFIIGSQRYEYYLWKNRKTLPEKNSKLIYSSDFCSEDTPDQTQNEFVIHFAALPQNHMIDNFLFFGSNYSLGNVIYGSDCTAEEWRQRVIFLNKHFIPWFFYSVKHLPGRVKDLRCVAFTSDSELMISVSSKSQLCAIKK